MPTALSVGSLEPLWISCDGDELFDDVSDEPLFEMLSRMKRLEDRIFCRVYEDGKWCVKALSSLSHEEWAKHVTKWILNGHEPVAFIKR